MTDETRFVSLDDLVKLAVDLLGEPAPIRDVGLLGSAAARPQTTVFGEDAYLTIHDKAAALLHSVVTNHALVDGNKRLGWLAASVFLDINGIHVTDISNDDVYDLVIRIASEPTEVSWIAARLRELTG